MHIASVTKGTLEDSANKNGSLLDLIHAKSFVDFVENASAETALNNHAPTENGKLLASLYFHINFI